VARSREEERERKKERKEKRKKKKRKERKKEKEKKERCGGAGGRIWLAASATLARGGAMAMVGPRWRM